VLLIADQDVLNAIHHFIYSNHFASPSQLTVHHSMDLFSDVWHVHRDLLLIPILIFARRLSSLQTAPTTMLEASVFVAYQDIIYPGMLVKLIQLIV
jgi:hypothetical protein